MLLLPSERSVMGRMRAMVRLARDQLTYEFSAATPPVARIAPGETVVVETYDTSTGRVNRPEDIPAYVRVRDPHKVNPAAGPIYVEGAQPGDALVVEILDIRLQPQGFARVIAGAGVLQEGIEPGGVVMVRVDGDDLIFGDKVRLRARPMVGVIGTAPAEGVVYTLNHGPNGGNIDVNAITVGTRVHLPVSVPGALLAIGDVHAAMGDGEVCGTGVEIAGEVTARVDLVPGAAPRRIWLETDTDWITIGGGPTLDDAVGEAIDELCRLLMARLDLSRTEAFLLISARGDARVGQCARLSGLDATAYATFPRAVERL
jgi:amidase